MLVRLSKDAPRWIGGMWSGGLPLLLIVSLDERCSTGINACLRKSLHNHLSIAEFMDLSIQLYIN